MPKITVRLYTTLKDKLGASKLVLEGDNIAQVLDKLKAAHEDVDAVLFQNGVVKNHFTLALNSEVLDPKKVSGVSVKDGDLLHIFPPIAGG